MMLRLGLPALGSKLRFPTRRTPRAAPAGPRTPIPSSPSSAATPRGSLPSRTPTSIRSSASARPWTTPTLLTSQSQDRLSAPVSSPQRTAVRRRGYWAGNHPGDPRFQVREGPGSARARYSIGCTSKTRPAMSHFFPEPNHGRRRTAVRFRSRRDARSAVLTFFPDFLIRILSRRRRSGTPTRSSGTKSARSTGERSTKIDARGGLPRLPTPPLRSSAERRRRTNSSPSERRKALRPRRTTSPCAANRARWMRRPIPIQWRPRRRALVASPGTCFPSPRLTVSFPRPLFFFLRGVVAKAD